MNRSNLGTFVILMVPIMAMLIYETYSKYLYVPKFKVGDCISQHFHATEFMPEHNSKFILQIVAVGKENYLYEIRGFSEENKIQTIDGIFVKVDCE